jgi:predicted AAA+ superfamily ATPase
VQVYEGLKLKKYETDILKINPNWNKRDFTSIVGNYLNGCTEKILAVAGLRGTGKTTGILQAASDLDIAYILVQKDEVERGEDYIYYLKSTDKKYIVIDEYSWIKDRENLDYYLLTAVQNGKRIVLTATESITLELLNYGALCHRVDTVHTTMFTYEEYLRLNNKKHSKATCEAYLTTGGLFENYILRNFDTTKDYIETAIVKNLSGYLKKDMSEEKARTLTYCVLYKAICPSNLSSVPTLRKNHVTLENFLEQMGVNITYLPQSYEVARVADLFEQVGIIVRIPNFNENSNLREQYYITNPSLTCQLIKMAYGIDTIENAILGHVFEASVAVQLYTNMLSEHKIYFYNNGNEQNNPENKELDLIITDLEEEYAYFFECKYKREASLKANATLLSGYLENHELNGIEIEGRYVVYNGNPTVKEYDVGTVIFTPIGNILDDYFEFENNVRMIVGNDDRNDVLVAEEDEPEI